MKSETVSYSIVSSNTMDWSPLGFSTHGICQARILEWVAISSSRGYSKPRDGTRISCIAGRFFTRESPGKPILMKLGLRKGFGLVLGQARESHGRRLWSMQDVVWEKFPFIGYFNEHDLKRREWSKAWAGIGQEATGPPISQDRRVFCHFCGLEKVRIYIWFQT